MDAEAFAVGTGVPSAKPGQGEKRRESPQATQSLGCASFGYFSCTSKKSDTPNKAENNA